MRATHRVELADAKAGLRLLLATALVGLGAALLCESSTGQDEAPGIEWERTQPGAGRAYGYSVVEAEDGGFAVAGTTRGTGEDDERAVLVLKTNRWGDLEWERRYPLPGWGWSIARAGDGGYIVTGWTDVDVAGLAISDVYLLRTDRLGEPLWERTFGRENSYEYGNAVRETVDGDYVVAGTSSGVRSTVYLLKTGPAGDIEWERRLEDPSGDPAGAGSVVETADGGFAISGTTGPGGFGPDWGFLAKTDAAGELLWWETYDGVEGLLAEGTDDGGFVVAGVLSPRSEAMLGRTDASGNLLWERSIPAPWGHVASVAELAGGGFLLSGNVSLPYRVHLVRTDAEGAVLWEKTIETKGTSQHTGVARPTSDGGYIVTADSQGELYLGKLGYRGHSFLRGDANGDGAVDLSDAVRTLNALFLDGGPVSCGDAADSNDDGGLDGSDAVYTLRYLFQGGGDIPFPGPKSCRNDPTPDELRCESFPRCF